MKHTKKLISLVLLCALFIPSSLAVNTNDLSSSTDEYTEIVRETTREEFLQSIAEERNITYEEADALDRQDTAHCVANETNRLRNIANGATPRSSTVYKIVEREYTAGNSLFDSRVYVAIHTKLI